MAVPGMSVLKRVATLNRSGTLAKPVRYSEVRGVLDVLRDEHAASILQQLAVEASSVDDPVAFIRNAAPEDPVDEETVKRGARHPLLLASRVLWTQTSSPNVFIC